MNHMFDNYIIEHIFSFMTTFEKSKMKCVCGKWNTVIGDITVKHHEYPHRLIGLPELRKMGYRDIFYIGCYNGILELVNLAEEHCGARNWDWSNGLYWACCGGDMGTINLAISKGGDVDYGLAGACRDNHLHIIELMISQGATSWGYCRGMVDACRGGHLEIVKLMLANGANKWDSILGYACIYDNYSPYSNNLEIINCMISSGANDLNGGLYGACRGGKIEIINLLMSKGATDLNYGLFCACSSRELDAIKLMVSKGATECLCGLSIEEHLQK